MTNPLIDDMMETSAIPQIDIGLPTRGVFYPKGEVLEEDCDPCNLRIHALSVLDESTIKDPLMLVTGKAISKMIRRTCPDVINPGMMTELDVQAMLIASRIASYGAEMKMQIDCSHCGTTNELQIDLNEHIQRFGSYTDEEMGQFELDLETVNQKVRLRPITYEDSVDLTMTALRTSNSIEGFKDADVAAESLSEDFIEVYSKVFEDSVNTSVHALVSSIYVVYTSKGDPVMDREVIKKWIMRLPPAERERLTDRIKLINQDIRERSMLEFKCVKCGKSNRVHLELDPQKLFTPAEDQKVEKSSSAKSKSTAKTGKARSRILRK